MNIKKHDFEKFNEAIALVFGSIVFILLLLLVAEGVTRLFSDVTFLGNSRNLFVPHVYGESKGNAPYVVATSFGVQVFTDKNGFRIPDAQWKEGNGKEKSVLLLGDSVAFGPGVKEEETFSGLLRASHPNLKVYNASVIGYSAVDYKNFIEKFPVTDEGISRVFLFFCLNDIDTVSSREIDKTLSVADHQATGNRVIDRAPETGTRVEWLEQFVSQLERSMFVTEINKYLRTNSKLYLLIKGFLTDPQARYWYADYRLYLQENDARLQSSLRNILDINMSLKTVGIKLTVIILPYEYQLRSNDPSQLMPQNKLAEYFSRHGVDYIDSTPFFIHDEFNSKYYFLPYDPMHLSKKGHELVYRLLGAHLD